jgi:1-acyl-sn-glycerol-3-phosphate acyltransferase
MDNYTPPPLDDMQKRLVLAQRYFNPIFLNSHQLDLSKPALFVGNHTIYGLLDVPFLIKHIRLEHGVHLRSLGDRMHFHVPLWRDFLVEGGMVLGNPDNCHALMNAGESILVFPGGAREVMRRKGEKYQLIWKQRTGFARLAIEHGYDIIPFASVGPDDCFDIQLDANDLKHSTQLQRCLKTFKLDGHTRDGEVLPPLSTGLFKLPIPKPERFYFGFGERINTQNIQPNKQGSWEIREQVAYSIEQQITQLQAYRVQDRQQHWSWLRKQLTSG